MMNSLVIISCERKQTVDAILVLLKFVFVSANVTKLVNVQVRLKPRVRSLIRLRSIEFVGKRLYVRIFGFRLHLLCFRSEICQKMEDLQRIKYLNSYKYQDHRESTCYPSDGQLCSLSTRPN